MIEESMANSAPRSDVQFAALPRTRKQTIPRNGQEPECIELAVLRLGFRVTRKRSVCGFYTLYKSVNPRTRELAAGQLVARKLISPSPSFPSTRGTWSKRVSGERSGFVAREAVGPGV